jgi:chromatin structure-remodeling complex subunit RSC1/2
MATGRAASATPVPTTEKADPGTDGAPSAVTEDEWAAMSTVLATVYSYRTEE